MRAAWPFLVISIAAAVACTTDYQKGLDDPKYGSPNVLAGQQAPGASVDETPQSSSGTATGPKCGTPVAPDPACAVTFAQVIAELQKGSCGAGVSCHAAGGVPPVMDLANPTALYDSLANFTASKGIYLNPCSKNAADSAIVANLDPANPNRGTVMPPQVGMPAAVPIVKQYVECGSPKP